MVQTWHDHAARLETLRTTHKPLTARQIAEALLVGRGARDDATPKALRNLTAAVQVSLVNHEGKTVARVGEGMPGRWKLILVRDSLESHAGK